MKAARHRSHATTPTPDVRRARGTRWRTRVVGVGGVAVAALLLAACSGGISPKLSQGSTTTSTTPPGSTTTTTHPKRPKPATTQVALFFDRGTALGVAHRSVPVASVRYAALRALFAGPDPSEQAAGLRTSIPTGSILEGLSFNGSLAYVSVNSGFFAAASTTEMTLRLAEIVYTLTEFSGVTSAQFYVHGATLSNVDGIPTSRPLDRTDLAVAVGDFLLVSPAVGDTVTSPVTISGLSEFSGTLEVQITDSAGKLIVNTVATTTVGESFTYTYPYTSNEAGPATVKVFAAPNRSSNAQLVAAIPVTLGR